VTSVNTTWGGNPAAALTTFSAPLIYSNPREVQLAARFSF